MKISFEPVSLTARHTFKIAREELAGDVFENVIVKLEHDGLTGWGEAAPFVIYGENQSTALAALETMTPVVERYDGPWLAERLLNELDSRLEHNYAAKAAIDMALFDLQGKLCGQPLFRLLGLDPAGAPLSSFTIGLDNPEIVRAKVHEVKDFPLLKVKVGGPEDMECLKVIREEAPGARLRVDANCGWDAEQTGIAK